MFSFTKKIVVAAVMLAVCSGQVVASTPHDGNNESVPQRAFYTVTKTEGNTQIRFQDGLPSDVFKLIFEYASKAGADPRNLEVVCKYWYQSMRYNIPNLGARPNDSEGIPYTTKLNDVFMEECMRRCREGTVSRAILIYIKGEPDEKHIRFSEFKNGVADLTGCSVADLIGGCSMENDRQVYTTSIEKFFEVGGMNKNRLVMFIGPCHLVQAHLPVSEKKPSMVVILWRLGDDENKSSFDYLAERSIKELGAEDFYENWMLRTEHGHIDGVGPANLMYRHDHRFSCSFVKPKSGL